jgi:hypothetical protein
VKSVIIGAGDRAALCEGNPMRSTLFAATLLIPLAAAPAPAELVTLQPRPGVALRLGVEARPNVAAIAILFAGGHGKIELDDGGQPQGLRGNFLIRARAHLAARGIGNVLIDAPSDRQGERGMFGWRQSAEHAGDIGAVVRAMRQRFQRPVWLVGTSAGTVSVANAAARLTGPARPDGIVLTATITRQMRGRGFTVFDVGIAAYAGPAFVASHEGDACPATPPGDAPRVLAALAGARPKKLMMFGGGLPPRSAPCEARAQHGFLGIEAQVMNAIADFILRPSN